MITKITVPFWISTVAVTGLLFVSAYGSAIAPPDCSKLKGCERKFCEIGKQLNIAKEKGNAQKVNGLIKSLDNAKNHCTDKGLKEDLIKKIEGNQKDIIEYESDINEAEEDGKKDKVRKYQAKIEEEKNKIKLLEDELSNLN